MGQRRPKVLVVEDDDNIALGIHRTLYRGSPGFDVLVAPSAEVGRALMREMMVDVLITDVCLPGMSGLDLACWAAVESPETQFVLITGSDMNALRDQARALGCLRLLAKPFEPGELRVLVQEVLECRNDLSGRLSALSAADLIQMLCLGQKTTALRIRTEDVTGAVMLKQGRLIHATWGDLVGEAAVLAVVAVQDGVFSLTPLPTNTPVTITRDWQAVLIEAARSFDEATRRDRTESGAHGSVHADDATFSEVATGDWHLPRDDGESWSLNPESLDSAPTPLGLEPLVAAARLVDRGFASLRAGNTELARRCWQAAQRLDPDNRSIELNLKRLESLGGR
jgi:DNA-binding response OmpR family regulator